MGYPVTVQEEETIALPLVRPIKVKGMTIEQVRELIRKAYWMHRSSRRRSQGIDPHCEHH